jgi:mRNA interferase MazF
MQRGEIRLVDFAPVRRNDAGRRRLAVIVSNDGGNNVADRMRRGVVTVVPLTSNVTRVYPFQVLLRATETGLCKDAKAQAEQVRAVDIQQLGPMVGAVPGPALLELDEALRLHLAL